MATCWAPPLLNAPVLTLFETRTLAVIGLAALTSRSHTWSLPPSVLGARSPPPERKATFVPSAAICGWLAELTVLAVPVRFLLIRSVSSVKPLILRTKTCGLPMVGSLTRLSASLWKATFTGKASLGGTATLIDGRYWDALSAPAVPVRSVFTR